MAWGDSVNALGKLNATPISDTFAPSDAATALQRLLANVDCNVGAVLADLVQHSLVEVGQAFPLEYGISDDVSQALIDSLTGLQSLLVQTGDATSLSDAALGRLVQGASASDAVVLADSMAAVQGSLAAFADSLSLSDTLAARFPYLAALSDNLSTTLADFVVHQLIEVGVAFPLTYNVSDSLALDDALSALLRLRPLLGDLASFIDSANFVAPLPKAFSDSVSPSDSLVALSGFIASLNESISLQDAIRALEKYFVTPEELVVVTDSVTGGAPEARIGSEYRHVVPAPIKPGVHRRLKTLERLYERWERKP